MHGISFFSIVQPKTVQETEISILSSLLLEEIDELFECKWNRNNTFYHTNFRHMSHIVIYLNSCDMDPI